MNTAAAPTAGRASAWQSRRRAILTALVTTGVVAGLGVPAVVAGNPAVWFVENTNMIV